MWDDHTCPDESGFMLSERHDEDENLLMFFMFRPTVNVSPDSYRCFPHILQTEMRSDVSGDETRSSLQVFSLCQLMCLLMSRGNSQSSIQTQHTTQTHNPFTTMNPEQEHSWMSPDSGSSGVTLTTVETHTCTVKYMKYVIWRSGWSAEALQSAGEREAS